MRLLGLEASSGCGLSSAGKGEITSLGLVTTPWFLLLVITLAISHSNSSLSDLGWKLLQRLRLQN